MPTNQNIANFFPYRGSEVLSPSSPTVAGEGTDMASIQLQFFQICSKAYTNSPPSVGALQGSIGAVQGKKSVSFCIFSCFIVFFCFLWFIFCLKLQIMACGWIPIIFSTFLELSKFHQIWIPGPLIYDRNTVTKYKNPHKLFFLFLHISKFGISFCVNILKRTGAEQ